MNANGGLARRPRTGAKRPVKPADPKTATHHKTTFKERRWAR